MRYLLFFLLLAVPCEAQIVRGDQFVFGTGALNTSRRLLTGAGSPESVVTAPVGSIYIRTDGGAGTSVYAKDSGAGSTGWVAVGRGTVSSVALSLPSFITVSGSPVTGTGTLTGTLASQTQNTFFAAPNGSAGAPTFRAMVAADVPTLNQSTTGSAATWTTPRLLAGNSVDGSANVPFANKFVVQGTTDTGLSGAQFLGALGTGIVKNTTTTGVLSIAAAGDFPTLNQNTTGTAATVTGATQAAITSAANLATVGTITSGTWNAGPVTSNGVLTVVAAANATSVFSGGVVQFNPSTSGAGQGVMFDTTNLANGSNVFFMSAPLGWTGNFFSMNLNSVQKFSVTQAGALFMTGTARMSNYGAGTATFDALGNITSVSDARLKDRIAPLPYGLAEVLRLRPVQYGYNERSTLEREHLYGGFLAQEVAPLMPLAVGHDATGLLTLSDRPILGAAVNAIQELEARITALEAKLYALEAKEAK